MPSMSSSNKNLVLLLLLLLGLYLGQVEANLRCYSCFPCNELEFFAGDVRHFERDCYFDRYCMKISGQSRDIFGYIQEVNIRGCPWVSLLTNLEEGCTETALSIAGAGLVQGTVCLCRDHLCNAAPGSPSSRGYTIYLLAILTALYYQL